MEYQVHTENVASIITAVVRRQAKQHELSKAIPQACGDVWSFVRSANLPNPGRHVALYLDGVINFECGVEIGQPFVGNDQVACSSTPAGLVATTAHIGPYGQLGAAHTALVDWCAKQGLTLAGLNWEIYGHWTDDVTKLRTDVYYLLKTAVG
ncbi:MAG TPA: GyrI-like domain-containing protein [Gemmataceae bacterium]|jgi:effector-binding domain-containing protein|nr:GyrI-like domain-containing protein [Gemmataceae bacterium]